MLPKNSEILWAECLKFFFAASIFSAAFVGGHANADDYRLYQDTSSRTRTGLQVERFKGGNTDSGTQGFLLGYRSLNYFGRSPFNLGFEMNFGAPRDGSIADNNLFYGGLSLGVDHAIAKIFFLDMSVLVGYGYGKVAADGIGGQSLVLQPSANFGFVMINGYRISFGPGYLYMPNASGFNAITFSLRIERKVDSPAPKGVDY